MAEVDEKLCSEIGKRIKDRRTDLKMTQDDVAEKAGLTQQFVGLVERGKRKIRADSTIRLSKALEVSTDYILTGQTFDIQENFNSQTNKLSDLQRACLSDIIKSYLKSCGCDIL